MSYAVQWFMFAVILGFRLYSVRYFSERRARASLLPSKPRRATGMQRRTAQRWTMPICRPWPIAYKADAERTLFSCN